MQNHIYHLIVDYFKHTSVGVGNKWKYTENSVICQEIQKWPTRIFTISPLRAAICPKPSLPRHVSAVLRVSRSSFMINSKNWEYLIGGSKAHQSSWYLLKVCHAKWCKDFAIAIFSWWYWGLIIFFPSFSDSKNKKICVTDASDFDIFYELKTKVLCVGGNWTVKGVSICFQWTIVNVSHSSYNQIF